uniref:Uncharacterized protein n=1 Tax=Arundo donax TaxID=35708 RepID=A0A0A9FF88_ARUDO
MQFKSVSLGRRSTYKSVALVD